MDSAEFDAKVDELAKHDGGKLLRIAFFLANDLGNIEEAIESVGRKTAWYYSRPRDVRDLMEEIVQSFGAQRIKHAVRDARIMAKNASHRAMESLIADLDHKNPKIRRQARADLLDIVGVKHEEEAEETAIVINLGEKAERALEKIWTPIEEYASDQDK